MTQESDRLHQAENRLPNRVLNKSDRRGNEYAWRQDDFVETVEAARQVPMAIIGGQVQYRLPDGTCELYWLTYDPADMQEGEEWIAYCNRTARECIEKFKALVSTTDFEKEALASFGKFLEDRKARGENITDYLAFVLYFDDSGTFPYQ